MWQALLQAAPAILQIGGAILGGNSAKKQAEAQRRAAADMAAQQSAMAAQQRADANAAFQPTIDRGEKARSYLDALTYGVGQTPTGSAQQVVDWNEYYTRPTPGAAYGSIQQEWESGANSRFNRAVRAALGPNATPEQLAQYYHKTGSWRPDLTYTTVAAPTTELTREAALQPLYGSYLYGRAGQDETELNTLAESNAGMLGQSYLDAYNNGATNNDADYATQSGYTDDALTQQRELSQLYADQTSDRIVGAVYKTGALGKLERAGQDAAHENALSLSSTERGWRQGDYGTYSDRRNTLTDARDRGYLGVTAGLADSYTGNMRGRMDDQTAAYNSYVNDLTGGYNAGQAAQANKLGAGSAYYGQVGNIANQSYLANSQASAAKYGANQQMWSDIAGAVGQLSAVNWGGAGANAASNGGYTGNQTAAQTAAANKGYGTKATVYAPSSKYKTPMSGGVGATWSMVR